MGGDRVCECVGGGSERARMVGSGDVCDGAVGSGGVSGESDNVREGEGE